MIVDRRLVATVLALAALVVAALDVAMGRATGEQPAADDPTPAVAVTPAHAATTTTVTPIASASPTTPPSVTPPSSSSSPSSTLPADAPVEDLVAAGRPQPDPPTLYIEDGHDHGDGLSLAAAGEAAAAATVALWSWRHDDDPNRLAAALADVATPDVITALLPTPNELARRRTVSEVAWALATPGPATADPTVPDQVVVVVSVDHHVTTATTPEAVVTRTASVRLQPTPAGWFVVAVTVTA